MTLDTASRAVLVVLPRLSDGRIILVHSAPDGHWALPTCPWPGHDGLRAAAQSLLHQATDYITDRFTPLGNFCLEGADVHCYLAEQLRPSPLLPALCGAPMTSPVNPEELVALVRIGAVSSGILQQLINQLT